MLNTIELTKSVPQERWGEFFDQFSDGNRGRHNQFWQMHYSLFEFPSALSETNLFHYARKLGLDTDLFVGGSGAFARTYGRLTPKQ